MKFSYLKSCFIYLILLISTELAAQPKRYSVSQAHSHNDYEQANPFHLAYQHGFGSVEADVFLKDDELFVAHHSSEIKTERTLQSLYLKPMASACAANGGSIYPDRKKKMQFLIDLKTASDPTLRKLTEQLAAYEHLWFPKGSIQIVISGNTPAPENFSQYPPFIFFDGRPEVAYTPEQLRHVALISQSFTRYSKWTGTGEIPGDDLAKLRQVVDHAHHLKKPFRFWASPDTEEAWQALMRIKADYINTDKITELAAFLNRK